MLGQSLQPHVQVLKTSQRGLRLLRAAEAGGIQERTFEARSLSLPKFADRSALVAILEPLGLAQGGGGGEELFGFPRSMWQTLPSSEGSRVPPRRRPFTRMSLNGPSSSTFIGFSV